jgi:hypothetical protein
MSMSLAPSDYVFSYSCRPSPATRWGAGREITRSDWGAHDQMWRTTAKLTSKYSFHSLCRNTHSTHSIQLQNQIIKWPLVSFYYLLQCMAAIMRLQIIFAVLKCIPLTLYNFWFAFKQTNLALLCILVRFCNVLMSYHHYVPIFIYWFC